MGIRTITHTESLAGVWEELVYTEARLAADSRTKDLAAAVSKLVARGEKLQTDQRGAWRAEIIAQAHVDKQDDDLDDEVAGIALDLSYADGGKKSGARFKRYFSGKVVEIVRLGLESEVTRVKGWVKSLASEGEAKLKAHGKALAAILKSASGALDQRTEAATERANQRVRAILPYVDDVNAARQSIHGELTKRAVKYKAPKDFADRFFRHATRDTSPAETANPPPAAGALPTATG